MTTPTPPAPAPATPAAALAGRTVPRLRNGELRAMVAKILADNAGTVLTPRNIAHTLNRSSGAVRNACMVLADRGEAEVASTKPLAYRATATTASAAASTITPASAPSGTSRPRRPKKPTTATPTASAAAASGAARSAAVTGPVMRPNGTEYHPRLLSGMPDVTALRRLREAGVTALLYGPPGTGKTSVVEAAFPDCITVQGGAHQTRDGSVALPSRR